MTVVSKAFALRMIKKYNINTDVIPLDQIIAGIEVEMEHGSMYGSDTNITHDGLELAFRIALAHFHEDPRYYIHLKKMEERSDKYWSKRKKPSIFNE
jgi:Protein of unknown function (DUF5661)